MKKLSLLAVSLLAISSGSMQADISDYMAPLAQKAVTAAGIASVGTLMGVALHYTIEAVGSLAGIQPTYSQPQSDMPVWAFPTMAFLVALSSEFDTEE